MTHSVLRQFTLILALCVASFWDTQPVHSAVRLPFLAHSNAVGRVGLNRYVTPTGQILTPAGRQVELPSMRPQALAVSPDGRIIVTSGRTNVIAVLDAATGQILQYVTLATNKAQARVESKASATDDPSAFLENQSSSSAEQTNNASSSAEQTTNTSSAKQHQN